MRLIKIENFSAESSVKVCLSGLTVCIVFAFLVNSLHSIPKVMEDMKNFKATYTPLFIAGIEIILFWLLLYE